MSNQIAASHRNKHFVSQVVTAFNERDIPEFSRLFGQHADPAAYKQIKTRKTPTDYALLSELMTNIQDTYSEDDAFALLLSLGEVPGMSGLARLGVYFATFAYLSEQDREKNFGEQSPLHLDGKDFEAINTYFNTYDGDEYYTGRHDIGKFYRQSVIKDQSAQDFLLNIEVCARVGIDFHGEMSRLAYEDKLGGLTAWEQYQQILSCLSTTTVRNMVALMKPSALTYEMVTKHGLTYAHPVSEFCAIFLPQAFEKGDIDLFKEIFIGRANSHRPESIEGLHKQLSQLALKGELTEAQKEMFQLVDVVQKSHEKWVARNKLALMSPSELTYDQVREYGLTHANPTNEFIEIFVPQVFERGDADLFDLMLHHHSNTHGAQGVEHINKLLTSLISTGEQTGPQKEMLDLVTDYQRLYVDCKIWSKEPYPCRPDGEFGPTP